jgi:hypothetical protein
MSNAALPPGAMTPRELRDLALARIDHAAVFFGEN